MQTLYIDRRDTRLDVDRERILVHSPSLPRPLSIAFTYLSSIVISAKTQLHSHVLLACASRGIPVIILDPRSCESHAQYIPPSSKVVHRKIKQFEVLDQDGRRLGYAKQLVYSQALQQYKLLRYWFKNREIEQTNQDQLIERLKTIIKMISTCQSLEQLRGLEGASAKIIFYTMSLLVPAWCKFKGRNRRPPRDPINVLLSLSYSLIYAECTRALTAHAIDPMLGFYHEPVHGRYSLACDLTERIRTDIEKWVIQLILEEHLRPPHFTSSEQYPCVLNKDGRAIFYPLWERRFKVWKKYIRMNAQQWARTIDQS
ncbi:MULTISPECIES: CRISPR-associated endonuclease Cas1 [Acinetobacter]|uniref:CRISPR-associated endonuclease Cas1 n=1 Tax=Acinetobacter TaxID=469 RepID=UPI001E43FD04|nr:MULTISPECIES: CRISPR-associated endonuclease Cas1 [Acinetobacter]MCD0189112.1 CRISPR-associated endonuclease Cas1 [Acinetobacter sp. PW68]MDV2484901.1 CRISPR-associated endonuclease Cas1 [Acinetobacter towneri]